MNGNVFFWKLDIEIDQSHEKIMNSYRLLPCPGNKNFEDAILSERPCSWANSVGVNEYSSGAPEG